MNVDCLQNCAFSNSVVFTNRFAFDDFDGLFLVPTEVSNICFAGEGTLDLELPRASDSMDANGAGRSRDAPKSRWARRKDDRMDVVDDVDDVEALPSRGASESERAENGPRESAQDETSLCMTKQCTKLQNVCFKHFMYNVLVYSFQLPNKYDGPGTGFNSEKMDSICLGMDRTE